MASYQLSGQNLQEGISYKGCEPLVGGIGGAIIGALTGIWLGVGIGFVGGVIIGAACSSDKRYTIDSFIGYERQTENLKANPAQSIANFKNIVTEKISNYTNLLLDYFRNNINEDKADKNNPSTIQKSLEKIANKDLRGEKADSSENYSTDDTLEYVGITENSTGESAESQGSQDSGSGAEGNSNSSE